MNPQPNPGADMNNKQLANFRNIADQMFPEQDWQWIGKWESQRHFGISQERAEAYAKRHGGEAKKMGSEL